MTVNYADAAAVLILALSVLGARRRGITGFVVGLTGNIIALFLSVTLFGKVSAILRQTPLFAFLYGRIRPLFDFESFEALAGEAGFTSLFMENTVTERLLANDNSEIYKLFGVDTFADYVSSYIANIALNIISVIAVYMVVGIVIRALFRANVVFSGLPVIKQLNFVTGMLGGLLEGIVILWIMVIVLVFFALQGSFLPVYEMLLTSSFAIYFYKYNVFMYAILSITA